MSYNVKENTITVDGNVYNVERTPDRGHPEETLTVKDFDVNADDWVFPFDGLEATIGYEEHDTSYANPRDWSNVGTMAVHYNGYSLGDEDIAEYEFKVKCEYCDGSGEEPINQFEKPEQTPPMTMPDKEDCHVCGGEGEVDIHPVKYFMQYRGARVVLPLTVYEHSGITMYAGNVTLPFDTDRWDTSFVGFIFDTPEGVKQCIGDNATDEQIEEALRDEVKVYASYLEGDVKYFVVSDDETDFHESCHGFVGDDDGLYDQCFDALESAIEKRLAENTERAEWNARGTETK